MPLVKVTPERALQLGLLDGKPGKVGEQGIQGPEGPPGRDGLDGIAGVSIEGQQGVPGKAGRDGEDGTDAVGTDGEKGDKGEIGDIPKHEWQGTGLRFEEAPGEWGKFVNLEGRPGPSGGGASGGAILPKILKDIANGTISLGTSDQSLAYFLGE